MKTTFVRRSVFSLVLGSLLAGAVSVSAAGEKKEGYSIGLSTYSLRQLFSSGKLDALQ